MQSKFLLLGILILGLALRLINLNQSLWLDEAISVNAARNFSVVELLTKFSPGDFHPPLHYLLLKVWISVFGASEISARSLSVLFGVATIWVVFLIGRKLFTREIGMISALFMATAPLHIYYSQEARMYVPATFFATAVVWLFLKLLREQNRNLWIGLTVASSLLLYTDYLPGFMLAALILYLFVFEREQLRVNAKKWATPFAYIVLLFAFWLPTFLQQLQSGLAVKTNLPEWWQALGGTTLKQLALVPVKFMIGRISAYDKVVYASMIAAPSAVFTVLFVRSLFLWQKTKVLWVWLALPILAAATLSFWVSAFSYFRLLFVLPAFYLLLAAGAISFKKASLRRASVASILLVNLLSSGIYLFNPRFHREDWRGATSWIEGNSAGQTAVLFVGEGQQEPYKYYSKSIPSFGPDGLAKGPFDTIFLVRYVQPILDPQDLLRQKVEERGYRKLGEHDLNGVVVWEYVKTESDR